jgi:hypothetical protein
MGELAYRFFLDAFGEIIGFVGRRNGGFWVDGGFPPLVERVNGRIPAIKRVNENVLQSSS